ncbi:NADAR family protein [Sulfuriferula sp.]|uniref:NADAR family protein n=1 Tax=Sulfuriferula sp. TaxID=2025307 RepID=UPI0027315CE1|nr:NADAR family protein [Sulfuriferula sp.]MDP2025613.1 NADAR family protein [Sulfuriferula sp.]
MNKYVKSDVVRLLNIDEVFDGLSNMSGEYPVLINGLRVLSSEHLYQALKFPDHPSIQLKILEMPSPLRAKLFAARKVRKSKIRADWETVKLDVMDYCLRAKLITHWVKFGGLLRSTGHRDIVGMSSMQDAFWGVAEEGSVFRGDNNLGRLLTILRNEFVHHGNEPLRMLAPSPALGLLLNGAELATIDRRHHLCQIGTRTTAKVERIRP